MNLDRLLSGDVFTFAMVFCRFGGILMMMPGLGELVIPARIRLLFALAVTLIATPLVSAQIPALPNSVLRLFMLLGAELLIGLFLGLLTRVTVTALSTAGYVISNVIGLSNIFVQSAATREQGSIISSLLGNGAILLILITDAHQMLFRAAFDSYTIFGPGQFPLAGDLSAAMTREVATSFKVAIELSLPFIVVGVVFQSALGVLTRLVPNLPIYFVTQPIQIVGGMLILAITLPALMMLFLRAFDLTFQPLFNR